MVFWATLIRTIIKMIIVGAFALGGLMLGRYLRRRKEDKKADTTEK